MTEYNPVATLGIISTVIMEMDNLCCVGKFSQQILSKFVENIKIKEKVCPNLTRAEGQVFGIGCKIFTIAGPVILYGILSSWVLGVIYWIGGVMGVL